MQKGPRSQRVASTTGVAIGGGGELPHDASVAPRAAVASLLPRRRKHHLVRFHAGLKPLVFIMGSSLERM